MTISAPKNVAIAKKASLPGESVARLRTVIQLVGRDPEGFAESRLNAHQSLKRRLIRSVLLGISGRCGAWPAP